MILDPQAGEQRFETRTAILVGLLALAFLAVYSKRFFPTPSGLMGHDHGYFLPYLLAGEYWFHQNGVSAVPHFVPAFCGGLPWLANPQSLYYSLPQLLSLFLGPLQAVWLTQLLSATGGAAGCYLLLSRRFGVSPSAALLGAILFLLNGFLLFILAIGHLTYHALAVVPWIAFLALAGSPLRDPERRGLVRGAALVAAIGLLVSYFLYGGAANYAIPAGFMVASVVLLHQLRCGVSLSPWLLLSAGSLLAIALSAAKLVPSWLFVSQFPRLSTELALFDGLPRLLRTLFLGVFLPGQLPDLVSFGPDRPSIGRHELELGISLVPLIVFAAYAAHRFSRALGWRRRAAAISVPTRSGAYSGAVYDAHRIGRSLLRWVVGIALVLVLTIPVLINVGDADWQATLKELPYIKHNSILVRWWSIYSLFVVVLTALAFDKLELTARQRAACLAFGLVLVVGQLALRDPAYYFSEFYDPEPIQTAHERLRREGTIPVIATVARHDRLVRTGGLSARFDDRLTEGVTAMPCYEPIFGYNLEDFPPPPLTVGPVWASPDGVALNLKKPACYLFGKANSCEPGDLFRASELVDMLAFASFRPLPHAVPPAVEFARRVTSVSLVLVALIFLVRAVGLLSGVFRRWQNSREARS